MNISEQFYYTGRGPLDSKMAPVENIDGLKSIPRSERFIGLTVVVLDDGSGNGPREYWLKESLGSWVLKSSEFSGGIDCGTYEPEA